MNTAEAYQHLQAEMVLLTTIKDTAPAYTTSLARMQAAQAALELA